MRKLPLRAANSSPIKMKAQTTSTGLMQRLRKAVAPPGKTASWLSNLPDDKLAEVYHRLMLGQTVSHVVRVIKEQWHLGKTVGDRTLYQCVTSFKKKCLPEMDQVKQQITQTTVEEPKLSPRIEAVRRKLENKALTVARKLDSMREMADLILEQKEHYMLIRQLETELQMPQKGVERAGEVLGNLISSYIDKEIKLGLRDAEPSKFKIEVKHRLEQVLGKLDDGGVHMIEMTQAFLDMAEPECILLEALPDGTYKLPSCNETDDD